MQSPVKGVNSSSPLDGLARRALQILFANLSHPHLSTGFIAEKLNRSRDHTSRRLHALLGDPAQQYIVSLRITRACYLLGSTSMPVQDIARAVGFTDPNYFRSVFKSRLGAPPSIWRRAMRANR